MSEKTLAAVDAVVYCRPVVINGEQIVKIVASKDLVFSLGEESWKITFHLSEGSIYDLHPGRWTRNFVREVFQGADEA